MQIRLIVIGALLGLAAGRPVAAQSYDQLRTWCYADNAFGEQTIQGCIAVIKANRETPQNLDAPIANFNTALQIEPNRPYSLFGRGVARCKKGDAASGNTDMSTAMTKISDTAEEFARYGSPSGAPQPHLEAGSRQPRMAPSS